MSVPEEERPLSGGKSSSQSQEADDTRRTDTKSNAIHRFTPVTPFPRRPFRAYKFFLYHTLFSKVRQYGNFTQKNPVFANISARGTFLVLASGYTVDNPREIYVFLRKRKDVGYGIYHEHLEQHFLLCGTFGAAGGLHRP